MLKCFKKIVLGKRVVGRHILRNFLIYNLNKNFIKRYLKLQKKKILEVKRKYKVNQIWIWHFHFDWYREEVWLRIFEAYIYRYRLFKTKLWWIVADLHLWTAKYQIDELNDIISLIKKKEKVIFLGDVTEHTKSLFNYTLAEKYLLNLIIDGVERWNVIYIRWNHDSCIFKKWRQEYIIIDDILLMHWDIFLADPRKPNC